MDSKTNNVRLCIIGAEAVGKTSLCARFVNSSFNLNYNKTESVTRYKKLIWMQDEPVLISLDDFFPIDFALWNESGGFEEKKKGFERALGVDRKGKGKGGKNASEGKGENGKKKKNKKKIENVVKEGEVVDGVLCVFDLMNRNSFEVLEGFLKFLNERENERFGMRMAKVLVGNKSDCGKGSVKASDIERIKLTYSLKYIKTSSKTSKNIEKAFNLLISQILSTKSFPTIDLPEAHSSILPSSRSFCFDCSKRSKSNQVCEIT